MLPVSFYLSTQIRPVHKEYSICLHEIPRPATKASKSTREMPFPFAPKKMKKSKWHRGISKKGLWGFGANEVGSWWSLGSRSKLARGAWLLEPEWGTEESIWFPEQGLRWSKPEVDQACLEWQTFNHLILNQPSPLANIALAMTFCPSPVNHPLDSLGHIASSLGASISSTLMIEDNMKKGIYYIYICVCI